jgi:hypothetical protein
MPTAVKVKAPSFYKIKPQSTSKSGGSNLPLYSALILAGVAVVFVLRNKQTKTIMGPVLTVVPSNDSDASAYANMIQGVHALSGQVALLPETPPGGASSPITPNPGS